MNKNNALFRVKSRRQCKYPRPQPTLGLYTVVAWLGAGSVQSSLCTQSCNNFEVYVLLPQRNKNVLEATSVTPNLNCVFYVQGATAS